MSDPPAATLPSPVRRLARAGVHLASRLLRRRPGLRRHLQRLRFGNWATRWLAGHVIVTWRGVRVDVDPGEAHGFHVFVLGDYGGAELDACVELCREARVFVDVGAHIGLFSLAVARACPALHVVAIEADPDVAAWLTRNVALNPDLESRITLVEAAAAAEDGEVLFEASRGSDNVGTGHIADEDAGARRPVTAIALGPWLVGRHLRPDVVKIDVEGGELGVLDGLWAAGEPADAMLLETHGHLFADADAFNLGVAQALTARGYKLERLERGRWKPLADPADLGGRAHVRAVRPTSGLGRD